MYLAYAAQEREEYSGHFPEMKVCHCRRCKNTVNLVINNHFLTSEPQLDKGQSQTWIPPQSPTRGHRHNRATGLHLSRLQHCLERLEEFSSVNSLPPYPRTPQKRK